MQSVRAIAEGVRNGALSPTAVVSEAFARIDALDSQIHAWVEIDRDAALQRAAQIERAREQGQTLGPLAGVPVGIKDIVDVLGFQTRAGAPPFAHYTPATDSTVARKLREAGAIILGKTHTTEFAYLDPAPTRNPWNRDHTPGGSSSGSAASVATAMIPLAIGSQTVGSVLRPAGYCGIVGLKPTFGRISYAGVLALAQSFDHLGLLCTSVGDAALALTVLCGYDPSDPNSLDAPIEDYVAAIADPPTPRIGIARAYYRGTAEPEIESHIEAVASRLGRAGAQVVDVAYPATAPEIAGLAQVVMRVEASIAHAERYAAHRDDYRANIKALVEGGLATGPDDYTRAKDYMRSLHLALSAILESVDVILLPTAPGVAPAGLETTGPGIFCGPASFTGLPAISLPSGISPSGLPYAVQLVGPSLGEAKLLDAAAWTERILDFNETPPLP